MKELAILYRRSGTKVKIQVLADGKAFEDVDSFISEAYAEGMMSDEFHHATQRRFKEPTEAIDFKSGGGRRLIEK